MFIFSSITVTDSLKYPSNRHFKESGGNSSIREGNELKLALVSDVGLAILFGLFPVHSEHCLQCLCCAHLFLKI